MYLIEKTDYGLHLVVTGRVDVTEATALSRDLLAAIRRLCGPNGIVADARKLIPVTPEVMDIVEELNRAAVAINGKDARAATILESPVVRDISRRMLYQVNIEKNVRFINASTVDNAEDQAVAWVARGIEPCAVPTTRPDITIK